MSALIRSTTGPGVPVGANSANQPSDSKPGRVSATVGTDSRPGNRCGEVTARARILPALTCWTRAGMPSMVKAASPASTALMAAGDPA